jgi:TatA/E family protein of Tat protein translocase
MGPLGWQETAFIFVLALLIFGPKKLPELGKTIGKAMTEFRRASSELKSTWDREMASLERENESIKDVARTYQNEIDNSVSDVTYDSSHSYYDSGYEYGYGSDTNSSSSSTVSAPATEGAELTASTSTPNGTEPAAAVASPETPSPAPEPHAPPADSKPVQA